MSTSTKKSSAKKSAAKGKRYTEAEKKEIIGFVEKVNAEKGRGGQSTASKKFGISQLTISSWLRAGVGSVSAGTFQTPKASGRGGMNTKLATLLSLGNEIERAEKELTKMKAKFNSIKASL
jgi:transposase-like protein